MSAALSMLQSGHREYLQPLHAGGRVILNCSCGDSFDDESPLNGDVIIPWFHAVAGHTLSEVESQPRKAEEKPEAA